MKKLCFYLPILYLLMPGCSNPKSAQSMFNPSILNGTWEVAEMPGAATALGELYPNKKPSVNFDVPSQKISGTTGCNTYNGPFKVNGSTIDFSSPLGMTRMMCPGEGESTFLTTLQKVNGWTVREEILRLMSGDLVVMQLKRGTE